MKITNIKLEVLTLEARLCLSSTPLLLAEDAEGLWPRDWFLLSSDPFDLQMPFDFGTRIRQHSDESEQPPSSSLTTSAKSDSYSPSNSSPGRSTSTAQSAEAVRPYSAGTALFLQAAIDALMSVATPGDDYHTVLAASATEQAEATHGNAVPAPRRGSFLRVDRSPGSYTTTIKGVTLQLGGVPSSTTESDQVAPSKGFLTTAYGGSSYNAFGNTLSGLHTTSASALVYASAFSIHTYTANLSPIDVTPIDTVTASMWEAMQLSGFADWELTVSATPLSDDSLVVRTYSAVINTQAVGVDFHMEYHPHPADPATGRPADPTNNLHWIQALVDNYTTGQNHDVLENTLIEIDSDPQSPYYDFDALADSTGLFDRPRSRLHAQSSFSLTPFFYAHTVLVQETGFHKATVLGGAAWGWDMDHIYDYNSPPGG